MAFFISIIILLCIVATTIHFIIKKCEDQTKKKYIIVFFIGFVSMFVAALIELLFIPKGWNSNIYSVKTFIGHLEVGFIEEAVKFLPCALFVYNKKYFNRYTDGVALFITAGLGAAFLEDIFYFVITKNSTVLLLRYTLIFFHPACTATIGYCLINKKLQQKQSYSNVIVAWIIVSIIHGVSDSLEASVGHKELQSLGVVIAYSMVIYFFVLISKSRNADTNKVKIIQ